MTDFREIFRLHSLGVNNTQIRESLQCSRQTVATTLKKAKSLGLSWPLPDTMSSETLCKLFYPSRTPDAVYAMPDCEWVYENCKSPVLH